eukprot:TRINITY_DN19631_c0_g1_i1.p1 TRINITY_DN19631_c0_g1~~TRINITY_DN19631_c0_g1_i1.p1  ORF type:complete len:356 (+),score=100.98 TRINITY_DN19631_c0_g1_i1:375-1442(+)
MNIFTQQRQQLRPQHPAPEALAAGESFKPKKPGNSSELQDVEMVSAFSELASSALGKGLIKDPSLLALAKRQFTGKLEESVRLEYASNREKQRDLDWHKKLSSTFPSHESVDSHMLVVLSSDTHPLGRCVSSMVDSTLRIFNLLKEKREDSPEQMLSSLAYEVACFSNSLASVVLRAFPKLQSESCFADRTVLAAIDTVLYVRLYSPVMEQLEKMNRVEDTQCDVQLSMIGGPRADAAVFKVGASLQLGSEAFSTVIGVMSNFPGIQPPLQKAQKLKQVCSELGQLITSVTGRPPGADEILPLFVYVVACAQVPKFVSQVRFMELFLVDYEAYDADEETYYIALARSAADFFLIQ